MSIKEQNEITQKPYSSDKSPLLRTISVPERILCGNDGEVRNRNVFSVTHGSCAEHTPSSSSRDKGNGKNLNDLNKIFLFDCENEQQDIAAMSVGSLYQSADGLDSDLDTDRLVFGSVN